jgi:Zinc carboxypeptidase
VIGHRRIGPLPELDAIERLVDAAAGEPLARVAVLATVEAHNRRYPIHALSFGARDPAAPVLVVAAGVHGLEVVGTHVAIAYLHTLLAQLAWDEVLRGALAGSRVVVVPLVNPGGMAARRRANPRGVDLMRNGPAPARTTAMPMIGGQRASPLLPWYMGESGAAMEVEARALCDLVEASAGSSRFAIAIDLHSGFGVVDRVWFPYARTRTPAPHIAELYALRRLLDRTLPNHVYRVEPTARVYTIRGDLWDHLYDRAVARGRVLLPLTLEMGSWTWVRKNPLQALSRLGPFNPIVPHRLRRTLRRHLPLLDFLHRAAHSASAWAQLDDDTRKRLERAAFAEWYA